MATRCCGCLNTARTTRREMPLARLQKTTPPKRRIASSCHMRQRSTTSARRTVRYACAAPGADLLHISPCLRGCSGTPPTPSAPTLVSKTSVALKIKWTMPALHEVVPPVIKYEVSYGPRWSLAGWQSAGTFKQCEAVIANLQPDTTCVAQTRVCEHRIATPQPRRSPDTLHVCEPSMPMAGARLASAVTIYRHSTRVCKKAPPRRKSPLSSPLHLLASPAYCDRPPRFVPAALLRTGPTPPAVLNVPG